MTILLTCPSCGDRLSFHEVLIGQTVPCPECRRPVKIQTAESVPNKTFATTVSQLDMA